MKKYAVVLEIQGEEVIVGYIEGKSSEDARFYYADDYLSLNDPKAISVSLPIQKEPFSAHRTRVFFDGMLPAGFMKNKPENPIRRDETFMVSNSL